MKRSWFSIFAVVVLLALLAVLAALQYVWLNQASDGERERLARVVRSDAERFAAEFDGEIQNAYFNFSTGAETWKNKNWREFRERYRFWREKTNYPALIKDIYFVANDAGDKAAAPPLRFDRDTGEFAPAARSGDLDRIKSNLFRPDAAGQVDEDMPALLLPVYEENGEFDRLVLTAPRRERVAVEKLPEKIATPEKIAPPQKFGALVIELDAAVIKNEILPALARKYFAENGDAGFRLAVRNSRGETIFQTGEVSAHDAEQPLFDLAPDNLFFFANRELAPRTEGARQESMVFTDSRINITTIRTPAPAGSEKRTTGETKGEFKIVRRSAEPDGAGESPRFRVFEGRTAGSRDGVWTLAVQHRAGSVAQFIGDARRKNLAVGFGILILLAACVVLIFVSAQRAQTLARRKIEFVSSVSHEFRTPLAVIYTAGENLADGVARERAQIARYGELIKAEGKKLSAMVEQILEYAGARSGRKKYDFRETNVETLIENALAECAPLLEEKGFRVEKSIAPNLPAIRADASSLAQAIQNLIGNSIKYSGDEKHLKISASNGGGAIKIAIEDRGLGIAPRDLKHVFEPFYRARAVVDEQIHGSGLGLSLVKQTVEAHGGRVSAESEIGRGSRFTIQLPAGDSGRWPVVGGQTEVRSQKSEDRS